jgi:O-methyltransferase domain/Dimerisation domain
MASGSVQPDRIFEISDGFKAAKVLLSAVELNLFTALAEGPLHGEALRQRLELAPRGARDFFDALVALKLLERDESGRYGNTAEAALYLNRNQPTYIGAELEFVNARQFGVWASLVDALQSGEPQSGARGKAGYSAYYSEPDTLTNVILGMTGGTVLAARALAQKFPWSQYHTIMDIGTAQGCLPVHIAMAHPHLFGGGFDLPALKPYFDAYTREHGLSDRLTFTAGDFFHDPLPAADVLIMGRVLHNWDLATKKMLLAKAAAAIHPGGALIVYERLIDDARRVSTSGLLASLNMLLITTGGFDFSGADCATWMSEAGFRDLRVEPLTTEISMVVGLK